MKPEEIKSIREELGITQEKLAYLLGASFSTVNRWENGVQTPSRLYIKEMRELLKNHGLKVRKREELKNA